MRINDNAERGFKRISAKLKDFSQSGHQNIMRMVFTVLITVVVAGITTYSNYRDLSIFHFIRCMFWNLKLWIPGLAGFVVYGGLTIAMKMNPDNAVERYNGGKDENGVQLASNGTYGTAAWMSKKEAYEILEVENIKNCNGVILGGFDPEGKEVVCIPRGTKKVREITNQNVCIFGSPGEGKSWGYARCNMLQAIRRGESVIVTDPKGELYTDLNKLYRQNGYKVKVFNLANPQKSDAWNCMNVCFNKVTGNVDLNRVKIFVEAIMKNTSDPDDTHDYFANNEKTLYEAVIMYMAEKYISDLRQKLYKIVEHCNTDDNKQTYYAFCKKFVRPDSYLNDIKADAKRIFATYGPSKELIKDVTFARDAINRSEGKEIDPNPIIPAVTFEDREKQFDEFFELLTLDLVKPTLSNIYHKINKLKLKEFEAEVDALNNPTALCHIPLSTILQQGENVWPNFVNGCSVRLNVLNDEILRLMVSEDDIDLSAPGREKCAYFCIFPDQDFTFQFVSSLFFTFLFKDQIETADANGGNPVAINYILDEFANIGMIPDFSNKISTARSRNIGITMIVQTITQLYQIYSENITNTILGCCSTLICLGVNDDTTVTYFVNKLGETTIVARSTRDERKMGRIDRFLPEYAESLGEGRRSLLTFDEMRRIRATDLVVVCAHLKPLLLKKITANYHPLSNNGHFETSSLNEIPPFLERYEGCERRDQFAKEQYENILKEMLEYEAKMQDVAARAYGGEDPDKDFDGVQNEELASVDIEVDESTGEVTSMTPSRGFERDEYPVPNNATSSPQASEKPQVAQNTTQSNKAQEHGKKESTPPTAPTTMPVASGPAQSATDVMGILNSTQQTTCVKNSETPFGGFGKTSLRNGKAKVNEGDSIGRTSLKPTTANFAKVEAKREQAAKTNTTIEPKETQVVVPPAHEKPVAVKREEPVTPKAVKEREIPSVPFVVPDKEEHPSDSVQFICTPAPESTPHSGEDKRKEPITFTLADGEN